MNPTANHLVQLQELVLIRDEHKVTTDGEHLQSINKSIDEMTRQLPRTVRELFEKLLKKDHTAVVPIDDGSCSACRMKLPISQVQAVRNSLEVLACPACARLLYVPEAVPRNVGARPKRMGPRKVGIARFSSSKLMVPRLTGGDAESVIRELAEKMAEGGFVDNAERLIEQALRREGVLSTAVDHGLAFPHVRAVEGGGLTLALGLAPKGLHFDGDETGLTRIVFFLMIPTAASAFYLKLLAGLTETFMKADARKALLANKEPEKLWKCLVKLTRSTIK
jgi:mannitol/fructose-specific phosphotransferase system IIA component (Ntr-type)